jgi:hypothetical protein
MRLIFTKRDCTRRYLRVPKGLPTSKGFISARFNMAFLFRFFASLFLAAAVIGAVVDAARSIAASGRIVMTPLADALFALNADPYAGLIAFGEGYGIDGFWTPLVEATLSAPAILVFVGLALIFYALGYRRRPDRRHASHA